MKAITNKERLMNFLISGCKFSNTYFVLNFIVNGFKFDEKTKNEYMFSFFTEQSKGKEKPKIIPFPTIEKHVTNNIVPFDER